MSIIPRAARFVHSPASAPLQLAGRLLITVVGSGETTIQQVGNCEREGNASAALAEQLRPQLDRLADAVKRVGGPE